MCPPEALLVVVGSGANADGLAGKGSQNADADVFVNKGRIGGDFKSNVARGVSRGIDGIHREWDDSLL